MPKLTVVNLHPHSAFLLGRRGVGQEVTREHVPADTLFSALLMTWLEWGGRAEDWVAGFPTTGGEVEGQPPFLLTSAFPFAGGVRFYPKPLLDLQVGERRKELRRLRFISESLFQRVVQGEGLAAWVPPSDPSAKPEAGVALQDGTIWLTREEVERLPPQFRAVPEAGGRLSRALWARKVFEVGRVPRVTVDRVCHASEIYHTARLTFAPGCGLWFGICWLRPADPVPGLGISYREALATLLEVLGDGGMGGERTAGHGAFHPQEGEELGWPDPIPGEPFITLSRYHPRREELPTTLSGDQAAYELEAVGGWLQSLGLSAQRRRPLWLVTEGSVCHAVGNGPWGDVVDVRPTYEAASVSHPVWRYGLACPVALGGGA